MKTTAEILDILHDFKAHYAEKSCNISSISAVVFIFYSYSDYWNKDSNNFDIKKK